VGVSRDEWVQKRQMLGAVGVRLGEGRWICESLGECVSSRKNVRMCRSG
jgi:hypothetical protein